MLDLNKLDHIYLACGQTDMRKSIDGLSAIVQEEFQLDLYSNSLFLFCGRKNDRIKALYWDGDGFLLMYKRLEDGRFRSPRKQKEVKDLTHQQLRWLLEGLEIDQPKVIKKVSPKSVI